MWFGCRWQQCPRCSPSLCGCCCCCSWQCFPCSGSLHMLAEPLLVPAHALQGHHKDSNQRENTHHVAVTGSGFSHLYAGLNDCYHLTRPEGTALNGMPHASICHTLSVLAGGRSRRSTATRIPAAHTPCMTPANFQLCCLVTTTRLTCYIACRTHGNEAIWQSSNQLSHPCISTASALHQHLKDILPTQWPPLATRGILHQCTLRLLYLMLQ